MKKKTVYKALKTLILVLPLMAALAGCGSNNTAPAPAATPEPAAEAEVQNPAESEPSAEAEEAGESETPADAESTEEPEETLETELVTPKADGERFEDTILIEGMEEPVKYEHLINSKIGIEMDYDYEQFVRTTEDEREVFTSIYDDVQNAENYLEVTYSTDDAETVAAAIGEALSNEYDIIREPYELDNSGTCIRIDASETKNGGGTPDLLHMVYIIPSEDGCRVATAHYSFESAEGFGRRFSYMMKTLIVTDRE